MNDSIRTFDVVDVVKEALYNFFESYHVEDSLTCFSENIYESWGEIILYNYTSLIIVSGVMSGSVLVSCGEEFLGEVIKLVLGPRIDLKQEYYIDMVGEMSNTVSGYFQKFYGDGFIISSPTFLKSGQLADVAGQLAERVHVVGFDLFGFESKVLISLGVSVPRGI